MQHSPVTRLLPDLTFGLGEGPAWDDRAGLLYWVDIKAPALHQLDPQTGAHAVWHWPEVISCCGLAESGEVIVSGRSGLWVFDPQSEARDLAYPIPAMAPDMRTNDGKVGPDGAFWVSTMQDTSDRGPVGVVLRITGDGQVTTMLEGLTTANGMEWSRDGDRFYLADTRALWIDCWEYDPVTVTLSNRRRFVTYEEDDGKPDGGAMDAHGAYWSAGIYAGRIHRFSAEGERLGSVSIPAEMVTMPCFGGADMKTLFVTSLSRGADSVAGDGGLYSLQVDVPGPLPRRMDIGGRHR
ncbi:MAG: SMP-30/gluconolactonase/LRE family protein [Sulfitobacter sp.]|uniref:SMP-30/gluconolactonase/LRE family protein n=1 Tax=Sulfitobacter sp. TaxID=1903071 RepID=UPI0032995F47